jgi:hypothetical protein
MKLFISSKTAYWEVKEPSFKDVLFPNVGLKCSLQIPLIFKRVEKNEIISTFLIEGGCNYSIPVTNT